LTTWKMMKSLKKGINVKCIGKVQSLFFF